MIRANQVPNLKNVDAAGNLMTGLYKIIACLLGLLLPAMVWAEVVGSVTHLGGVLRVTRKEGVSMILSVKSEIMEGDTLRTEENTYARIKFVDGGEVVLRPETVLKVDAYEYRPVPVPGHHDNILLDLTKGGLRSVTGLLGKRSPEAFQMKTAAATIGIRGTHYGALLCNFDCTKVPTVSGLPPENGLHTDTADGTTVITNAAGSIEVPAGSFSYTSGFNARTELVPASRGYQVTMPQSISSNKSSGKGMGSQDGNACIVE